MTTRVLCTRRIAVYFRFLALYAGAGFAFRLRSRHGRGRRSGAWADTQSSSCDKVTPSRRALLVGVKSIIQTRATSASTKVG